MLCNSTAVCLQPEDMFVCDLKEQDISTPPAYKKLKKSQCTPLFMNAYTMRGENIHRNTVFTPLMPAIFKALCDLHYVQEPERSFIHTQRLLS